jgi:hypothetical protein
MIPTIAETYEAQCEALSHDGAFRDKINFAHLVNQIMRESTLCTYPLGTDSHDATEMHHFVDGSRVLLENPRQAAFCGNVFVPAADAKANTAKRLLAIKRDLADATELHRLSYAEATPEDEADEIYQAWWDKTEDIAARVVAITNGLIAKPIALKMVRAKALDIISIISKVRREGRHYEHDI